MKKSLFLYLFILTALVTIFTYTYFSQQHDIISKKLNKLTSQHKDTVNLLINQADEAAYFSFERNANAQDYFAVTAPVNVPADELPALVVEKLMAFNADQAGNPYTGQTQLTSKKFIINKAKLINHRWIVADYSDGTYWGEVLIKYFINPDLTVSFEVIQSVLHQK